MGEFKIPPPSDDDLLASISHAVGIASEFKDLVKELATDDLTGEWEDGELDGERLDENGRLFETTSFVINVGHYKVNPTPYPEVDRCEGVRAEIGLSTPEGGRVYSLITRSSIGLMYGIHYFEDTPKEQSELRLPPNLDPLKHFKVEQEALVVPLGVRLSELDNVKTITRGIRQIHEAGRLATDEPWY